MRAKIYDAMPQQPAEPLDFEVDLDDVLGQAERLQNGDTYPAGARAITHTVHTATYCTVGYYE